MSQTASASVTPSVGPKTTRTRRQLRGSSLLLLGQIFSKGANFATQILIVRYLSQSDYGAFAYALSIVALAHSFTTFGLDRAVTRFVPIYHEQQDYNRLFGTLLMVVGTILSVGLSVVLLFYGLQPSLLKGAIEDDLARTLLMILILLAPVQAMDDLLIGMFAVFSSSRSIFFRKHILTPGLKLLVVLALMWSGSSVFFLAGGYVLVGAVGVAFYIVLLIHLMRKQGLFQRFQRAAVIIPWREVLAFTVPLLTSDLVYSVMNSMDAVLLEHFHNAVDVAALRAVQPTARLNQMVLASFGILFTPAAARMFARNDREGVNNLYWQNAVWTAVGSFPIFALTFSVAHSVTLLLYGERYESSAIILALLSFAYYFNAALGQNGLTLKVFGHVRYIVVINVLAVVANLAINLLLIPRYGALGAAIGTTATLILHNILKQAGLRLGTGINLLDPHYFRVYAIITVCALGLLLVQWWLDAPIYVDLALAGLASLIVVRLNRRALNVAETFPEVLRLPLVGRLLR
ncbi:MAG: flippase [Caldilineaceae bacterium]|nr:flippase [Caldilineaceae bacterium]